MWLFVCLCLCCIGILRQMHFYGLLYPGALCLPLSLASIPDPCIHPRGAESPHCKDACGVRSQGWLLSPELLLPSCVTGRLLKPSEPQFPPS